MSRAEGPCPFYIDKKLLFTKPGIQPGITFGPFGDEMQAIIFGVLADTDLPNLESDATEDQELEYVTWSVTSLTVCRQENGTDKILQIDSAFSGPTIALSAPIYGSVVTTQKILEIARSSWLDYVDFEPQTPERAMDKPLFKSYLIGAYLDQDTTGYFCVNRIESGYIPTPENPAIKTRMCSYPELRTVDFDDPASLYALDYLMRQGLAIQSPFEVPQEFRPFVTAYQN